MEKRTELESDKSDAKTARKGKAEYLRSKMYVKLSRVENVTYFVVYIVAIAYFLMKLYILSQQYQVNIMRNLQKVKLPKWLGRRVLYKDITHTDFSYTVAFLKPMPLYLLAHVIGAQITRRFCKPLLPLFYFILSAIFICREMSINALAYLVIQPLICFIFTFMGIPVFIWISAIVYGCGNSLIPQMRQFQQWFIGGNSMDWDMYILTVVTNAWISTKCISFGMEQVWKKKNKEPVDPPLPLLLKFLAFCFYLPSSFTGPIMIYPEFEKSLKGDYRPWTLARIIRFLKVIGICIFWIMFVEFSVHFLYFAAIKHYKDILHVTHLMAGVGLAVAWSLQFYLTYRIMYGVPVAFHEADDIPVSPPPKCVLRIHLYSEMWKYFDNALYKFLHRYIYTYLLGLSNRFMDRLKASIACFIFIYVWHGTSQVIFIWSLLNFIGVTLEGIGRTIYKETNYPEMEAKYLSPTGARRFHALLGAPLFFIAAYSNFFFFLGLEVGYIYVYRLLEFTIWDTLFIGGVLYAACNCCIEVKNWDLEKQINELQQVEEVSEDKKKD